MMLCKENVQLLVVDFQEKLIGKILKHNQILKVSYSIVEIFSQLNLPIIYSEQYPKGLGSTVEPLKTKLREIKADKIEKTSFSCLGSLNDKELKSKFNKKQIVICGIEAHICILQTSLDLINRGFDVFLVKESVGSRNFDDMNDGLKRMEISGVTLINFEMLLFELIRDSKSPDFKPLSRFIKK